MTLIVQKFGGSSVGTIDRIKQVAAHVLHAHQQGHQVVVVVSAMQGETDRLIQLAGTVMDEPNSREYDRLVSTGELVSSALLAMVLQSLGVDALSLSGADAQIITTNKHQQADITAVKCDQISALLAKGKIPVVAGFQGISASGEITTLGRGGSDVTAVAIAAALKAKECQIFTDVDGVYTSDPRVVAHAKRLDHITYTEMLVLASLGAKVLQRQSVAYAQKKQVPLRVLSTFDKGPGTLVAQRDYMQTPWVSGVAFESSQTKVSIIGVPKNIDNLSMIKQAMGHADFESDMSVENFSVSSDRVDFSFTVNAVDSHKAINFAQMMKVKISAKSIDTKGDIAKLSLVGMGMKSHAGVASKVMQTLSAQDIPIYLIASTEAKISTVIDRRHMKTGAKLLHQAFGLG